MKKLAIKYSLEIIVIILGISISFYMEKQNALSYKEDLKNQSLRRVLKNIEVDQNDFKFNKKVNQQAIHSGRWLYQRKDSLENYSKDSIGYHLTMAIFCNTIFVDNQEEYRGLQNSGLIELIENEEVVERLQKKYTIHEFLKKIEGYTNQEGILQEYYIYNTTRSKEMDIFMGYVVPSTMRHKNIEPHIMEKLALKGELHKFYLNLVDGQLRRDSVLVKLIQEEIK